MLQERLGQLDTPRTAGYPLAMPSNAVKCLGVVCCAALAASCGGAEGGDVISPDQVVAPSAMAATAAPPSEAPADLIETGDVDVPAELRAALDAVGFDCQPSGDEQGVVLCDVEKKAPTVIVLYDEPLLLFLSHFLRRDGVSCEQVLPKLNELSGALDPMKLVCLENRVTFASTIIVPERGLTPKDVQDYAGMFQRTIGTTLRTSGLVESLK